MKPYYADEAVTLYHGDCVEVMETVGTFADHTITDPPYSRDVYLRLSQPNTKAVSGTPSRMAVPLQRANSHHANTGHKPARLARLAAGDIGAIDDLIQPVSVLLGALTRRWAIVFSDVESTYLWRQALQHSLVYIRTGAWIKPDAMPQMTGDRPGTGFEACTIMHAGGPKRWNGGGTLAAWTHFTAKGDGRPEGHPCPKPLGLMVELVTLFSDEGETILDPFAGSGTTAVAAKLNGRKCILIERSEQYCEVAAKRLQATEPGQLFAREPRAKQVSMLEKT